MQELVESFFSNSVDDFKFSNNLFPSWIHGNLADKGSIKRHTLSFLFKNVHDQLHATGVKRERRASVYKAASLMNQIKELCEGKNQDHANAIDWKTPLGLAIINLTNGLYDKLDLQVFAAGDHEIRPTQSFYSSFIGLNKYICPFCGINRYKNRLGKRREDFDHYLCKSLYPLSAANLKNLIPCCGTCNQDYKKKKDILKYGLAFYPYGTVPELKVEVNCLRYPSTMETLDRGEWEVTIHLVENNPNSTQKMHTWDRVYSVKERLSQEVAEFHKTWMKPITNVEGDEYALIEAERVRATNSVLERMEPSQIIKEAFLSFMKERANQSFVKSFFMNPSKIATSSQFPVN